MGEELSVLTATLAEGLLKALCVAPESQLSSELRNKSIAFRDTNPSLREQYDFLVQISRCPMEDASSFMRTLCSVDRYYKRPEDEHE